MALSPVLHQLHRTGRRRRYHPPPPRDHRDRVRRPDRRAAGSYAVGALWRQLGLGPVCRDRPQPAARRRHTRRFSARRRARGHPAAQDRQHSRPPDPPATQTHPAPAQPLALGRRMACAVAQHNRLPPPTTRLTIPPNTARPGTNKGKAGQTSRPNTSAHRTIKINAQPIQPRPPSVDPGLVAASYPEAMTEQSNAITMSHPPEAFLRLVNPIMKLLLHTPFAGPARNQLMVVNFTGRKSGRHYSIPLSAHMIDDILYAMTAETWKNNFREGAAAQVLHDGKTTTMRGELITDKALIADLYSRCAESYGVKRAERTMGLGFRDHQMPTHDQFAEAVDQLHLNAIRFTRAA